MSEIKKIQVLSQIFDPQRKNGWVLNRHKCAAKRQGQQADLATGEGGNQAQNHGKQGICGQHFMRRKATDKPGAGETTDKEAHHGAGQVVGCETWRHAWDLFDCVANQVAQAGSLGTDVAELRQDRPAPVTNAHQAGKSRGE